LYNILTGFGVPMKLVWLIKTCLNKMYNKVSIGKYLSDNFPVQNSLKQGDAFRHCFSSLLYNMTLRTYKKPRWG
jgi:hypothetical protein